MKNSKTEGLRWLKLFESNGVTKKFYSSVHGSAISSQKANSISMAARQGREFLEAAENSDIATKPIEIYYGLSSYLRAMILLRNKTLKEDDLEKNHGLKLTNYPSPESASVEDFMKIKIKFIKGEFTQWYEQTQSSFPLHANSSEVDWEYGYEQDLLDEEVTFGELLGLVPNAWLELSQIDGKIRKNFELVSQRDGYYALNGKATQSEVEECFEGIASDKVSGINNYNWNVDANGSVRPPQLIHEYDSAFGLNKLAVVKPISNVRLSPLSVMVISSYVMCVLARYRPSIWGGIWNNGNLNEVSPVLNQLMNIIQNYAPQEMSDNFRKTG